MDCISFLDLTNVPGCEHPPPPEIDGQIVSSKMPCGTSSAHATTAGALHAPFIYACSVCPSLSMFVVPYIKLEGRSLLKPSYAKGELSELGSKLSDKFEKVYVADIDGLNWNKPQLDIVQEICDEIPTLYEGGVRYGGNVIDLLITGAERAVVGTATLVSLEDLRGAFKLSENITFKVDFRDGIVSFNRQISGRGLLPLARDVREIGISDLLVPESLASDAIEAKKELGFTLGVFAPMSARSRYESLGADYIVTEDFGGK